MDQKQLIIILADISGYTRFMLDNRTSALHGQMIINGLIESILKEVDIPLTLQEIEGDAVFLYAAHPDTDAAWNDVVKQVSLKLGRFFDAFIAQSATMTELTPCTCAVCVHADQLGLKLVVHAGVAVFHSIAGRPQVSGPDVILAHRLLKNSVACDEYVLLTDAAYAVMAPYLPGIYQRQQEAYDGFGVVDCHVRVLDEEQLAARDAVYEMSRAQLNEVAQAYVETSRSNATRQAARQQLRNPSRRFGLLEKALMVLDAYVMPVFFRPAALVDTIVERGKRKPPSHASSNR
jgi:hypothetical protein